jgi:hypothetical protein
MYAIVYHVPTGSLELRTLSDHDTPFLWVCNEIRAEIETYDPVADSPKLGSARIAPEQGYSWEDNRYTVTFYDHTNNTQLYNINYVLRDETDGPYQLTFDQLSGLASRWRNSPSPEHQHLAVAADLCGDGVLVCKLHVTRAQYPFGVPNHVFEYVFHVNEMGN